MELFPLITEQKLDVPKMELCRSEAPKWDSIIPCQKTQLDFKLQEVAISEKITSKWQRF